MALMRFSKGEMLLSNTRSGLREFHLLQESNGNYKLSSQLARRCGTSNERRDLSKPLLRLRRGFNSLWENLYQLLRGRRHFHRQQLVAAWPIMVRRNGPSFAATDSFAAAQRKSAWR
jgi:hypothetical protein